MGDFLKKMAVLIAFIKVSADSLSDDDLSLQYQADFRRGAIAHCSSGGENLFHRESVAEFKRLVNYLSSFELTAPLLEEALVLSNIYYSKTILKNCSNAADDDELKRTFSAALVWDEAVYEREVPQKTLKFDGAEEMSPLAFFMLSDYLKRQLGGASTDQDRRLNCVFGFEPPSYSIARRRQEISDDQWWPEFATYRNSSSEVWPVRSLNHSSLCITQSPNSDETRALLLEQLQREVFSCVLIVRPFVHDETSSAVYSSDESHWVSSGLEKFHITMLEGNRFSSSPDMLGILHIVRQYVERGERVLIESPAGYAYAATVAIAIELAISHQEVLPGEHGSELLASLKHYLVVFGNQVQPGPFQKSSQLLQALGLSQVLSRYSRQYLPSALSPKLPAAPFPAPVPSPMRVALSGGCSGSGSDSGSDSDSDDADFLSYQA